MAVNGRIALRTTKTTIEGENRQRLWEKRCAAYEETVREVNLARLASATMSQGSLPPGVDYQGVLDAMYKSKEGVIADDALFDKINQELSWTPRAASVHRGFWPFRRS
jgi:hypothetical protein